MSIHLFKNILLLCGMSAGLASAGQDIAKDSSIAGVAEKNAIELYNRYMARQARLYNGSEQTDYGANVKEGPYFGDTTWRYGSVSYDSLYFEDVPMLYDVYADQLIIHHFYDYKLRLIPERIREFDMAGHHFVREEISKGSGQGFYDHLYDGKTTVLARRIKLLDKKITAFYDLEKHFTEKDNFFVLKEGVYHSCRSYRDLLHILDDRSKEIKRYLKKNKIKFSSDAETAIVRSAQWYDLQK